VCLKRKYIAGNALLLLFVAGAFYLTERLKAFLATDEYQIINKSKNNLPAYGTLHAAGMDLRANLEETSCLNNGA